MTAWRALMQTEELERLVEKTAARIDRHVVNTLLDKYNFVQHCSAIKRYLLLSQVRSVIAASCHKIWGLSQQRDFNFLAPSRRYTSFMLERVSS